MANRDEWRLLATAREAGPPYSSPWPSEHPEPDLARDEIRRLAQVVPAAGVADALLWNLSLPPVALDPDNLEPSSDPLESAASILNHFKRSPDDGCALPAGEWPGGVLVAVKSTNGAWRQWLATYGTEERPNPGDNPGDTYRSYRDPGRHSRVTMSRPVKGRMIQWFGKSAEAELEGRWQARRTAGDKNPTWVVWLLPAGWKFRNRRLGDHVDVIASGIVPWHVVRPDGSTLAADLMPLLVDPPPWLASAFGGKGP